jgi:hypothetical protein
MTLEVRTNEFRSWFVSGHGFIRALEFLHICNRRASESGAYICSPQRKLWVQVHAKSQARVVGGI